MDCLHVLDVALGEPTDVRNLCTLTARKKHFELTTSKILSVARSLAATFEDPALAGPDVLSLSLRLVDPYER